MGMANAGVFPGLGRGRSFCAAAGALPTASGGSLALWRHGEKGRVGAGAVADAGENVAACQPWRDAPDRLAAHRC